MSGETDQGRTPGPTPPARGARDPAGTALRRAWWSLVLYPLSFVAAFVIGEGLISVIADDVDDPAPWEILLAATPALVVFVLPGLLALWFGLRAVRLGRNDGKAPAALGVVVGLGFVGLNLASYVLGLLLG
jgi:hypothetical protein